MMENMLTIMTKMILKNNNNEDPVLVAVVADNYDTTEFLFENETDSESDEEHNIARRKLKMLLIIWKWLTPPVLLQYFCRVLADILQSKLE